MQLAARCAAASGCVSTARHGAVLQDREGQVRDLRLAESLISWFCLGSVMIGDSSELYSPILVMITIYCIYNTHTHIYMGNPLKDHSVELDPVGF